jgi:glycerol-3-phosphate dehydrogenase
VLLRRTRLGLVGASDLRDGERVEAVAAALGEELGWSDSRVSEESDAWSRVAEAEGLDPSRALAS